MKVGTFVGSLREAIVRWSGFDVVGMRIDLSVGERVSKWRKSDVVSEGSVIECRKNVFELEGSVIESCGSAVESC
jgi:hypothetical protein